MRKQRVIRLKKSTAFQLAARWEVHSRFALRRVGPEMILPAGAWLLELGQVQDGWEGSWEVRYRTAGGEVVALREALPQGSYSVVRDPEALRAIEAYRDLETSIKEAFGLSTQVMCPGLPPFALIRCPLCAGTAFTTVDLASVWCERCNARFFVRSTAGDPGFVVDVSWAEYNPLAAYYLLPRTGKLLSTLVLKDSADPREMDREDCSEACQAGELQLTDGSNGLRAGLHVCKIGTLYDWRRIYGQVPTPEDLEGNEFWEVEGQTWPLSATLRVLPLDRENRDVLESAQVWLEKDHPNTARSIRTLLSGRSSPPVVLSAALPDLRALQEGERYLLHHWLIEPLEQPFGLGEVALPVWWVVTPRFAEGRLVGWQVVRRNICPNCGNPVEAKGKAEAAGRDGVCSHRECREHWQKTGWLPPVDAGMGGRNTGGKNGALE